MTVYVDDMHQKPLGRYRGMKMCHMAADTHDELVAMADKIGVARRHLQYRNHFREHFDICQAKRALAVQAGAVEITMRGIVDMMLLKREKFGPTHKIPRKGKP
jgi:hypothetical protein